ncbi:MAG: cell division protein ZapA [Bacillota bacterium]|nr:cell division protein ZapA [Bacillota bacterium]
MHLDLNKNNKIKVDIYGEEYTIKGTADSEYAKILAEYVDQKMKQVANKCPNLPLSKIAVLTALNIADELSKLQEDYDNLIKLIEDEKIK